jgi:uncharacterized protein with von Willebrand factor type A (vWA) domain
MRHDESAWTVKIESRPEEVAFSREAVVRILQDWLDEHDGDRLVLNAVKIHELAEVAGVAQPRHSSQFIS